MEKQLDFGGFSARTERLAWALHAVISKARKGAGADALFDSGIELRDLLRDLVLDATRCEKTPDALTSLRCHLALIKWAEDFAGEIGHEHKSTYGDSADHIYRCWGSRIEFVRDHPLYDCRTTTYECPDYVEIFPIILADISHTPESWTDFEEILAKFDFNVFRSLDQIQRERCRFSLRFKEGAEDTPATDETSQRLRFDPKALKLYDGDRELVAWNKPAPMQFAILAAFERAGWPESVTVDLKRRQRAMRADN